MFDLKHKLHSILNEIKGFKAGYSSKSADKMVIEKDGKVYLVTFEELDISIETAVKCLR